MPHFHHAASGSSQAVLFTLILVFTALVYLKGWLSLRSNALKAPTGWQVLSFLVGLFLIWAAVASPIAALDHELLTVHMLQHLLLMTLAPPLICLGAPVQPLLHGLPRGSVENLLVPLPQSQTAEMIAKTLANPKFALLAASATLVGWHIPTLFTLGMKSVGWHLFEHLSFLVTGLLFWLPVVRPSAGAPRQFPSCPIGIMGYDDLMRSLFRFPNPVNETSARLVAAGVVPIAYDHRHVP